MIPRRVYFLSIILVLLLSSLGWSPSLPSPSAVNATATPTPSQTAWERPTKVPTRTPVPTRTKRPPTATVTLTPTITSTPTRTHVPAGELGAVIDEKVDLTQFLPSQPFIVTFTLPMNPATASGPALLSYPYLPGKLTWSANNTKLTFEPQGGFQPGRSYYLYLDHNLKSKEGKSFPDLQSWRISIRPAPILTGYSPSAVELSNLQQAVRIAFNREMDKDSVTRALVIDPPIQMDFLWDKNTLKATPRQPLEIGQRYQFSLSSQAVDTHGVGLDKDYNWIYTVAPLRVTEVKDGDKTIILKFNYPIADQNPSPPVIIEPALDGTWNWIDKSTLRFRASSLIPTGLRYTISFSDPLFDMLGNTTPELDPIEYEPSSPIASTFPNEEGETTDLNASIVITFKDLMDMASAEAAFHIDPVVQGTFLWTESSKTLSFKPDQPLEAATQYTVTLETSLRFTGGQPALLEAYTWSFTTTPNYYEMGVAFDEYGGANAQVLDADGRRAIQFTFSYSNANQAVLSLYRMDLGKFVELYREHFGKSRWNRQELIDTRELEKVATWPHKRTEGIQETLLPNDAPPGPYLLTVQEEEKSADFLFVLITHNTLTVKLSGTRLWVWASDINGESIPNLELRLYMEDGSIMREGKTDEQGIFSTTLPKDLKPLLVVARGDGEDVTASGLDYFWQGGSSNCCWWGETAEPAQQGDYRAYIYTERPIYKPGQTVSFKAVVRQDDDVRYSMLPTGSKAQVAIYDARENQIQMMEMPLSDFGTLNGEFKLAEGAMLGDYAVQVTVGRESFRQTFKVQEYKKPDYEVKLELDKEFYADGDTVQLKVDVNYFFGEPVVSGSVQARLYQLLPRGYDWWWQDIQIGAKPQKGTDYTWVSIYDQDKLFSSVSLDEKGHFEGQISLDTDSIYYNCRSSWYSTLKECTVAIEVTAKDGSNQTVSASKIIKVYSAPRFFTMNSGEWLHRPQEAFDVTVIGRFLDGSPAGNSEAELSVIKGDWWVDGDVLARYRVTTDADGRAVQPISIEKEGYYQLRLIIPGYDTEVSDWIYISSKEKKWGQAGDDPVEFNITAERTDYKPYEKARLLISSSFSGPALLTFERGRVIHTKPVVLTAPLTEVEAEIIPEDAPNIFVTINAYRATKNQWELPKEEYYFYTSLANSRLVRDTVELKVDASGRGLNVTIEPDQQHYEPRQQAGFTIRVTDVQGQPVAAELSAALVDEAIFSLSEDLSGDIFNAFYGRRPHTLETYNSMAPTRVLFDSGGRGGGGSSDAVFSPRSNFPDTAAWYPVLKTNEKGEARLEITLPDSLTEWRLTVKAVTLGTKVGETSVSITTQQEVVIRPQFPAQLTIGDQVDLSAVVHNYTGQRSDFFITLQADLLELHSSLDHEVTLQPGEARTVYWRVSPTGPGESQLIIRATAKGGTGSANRKEDAVQIPLLVQPRVMPDVASQAGDFTGEMTTVLVLPDGALPVSTIDLKVSRSITGNVLDGLEYLTGYPYGCVEQTMSRALPNAVVGRALKQLGISNLGLEQQLPELISAGLQRLYGYQHNDGGWGWWYDDRSDIYQSAWVVFGLSVTAESGHNVDPMVIERGAYYLQNTLQKENASFDTQTKSYILYALATAGYGVREQTLALAQQANELDAFSQAALALALDRLDEDEAARAMLKRLDDSAYIAEGQAQWISTSGDGEYHDKIMSSTIRNSALALSAYVRIDPQNERIAQIVRFLMGQRRAWGWGTTNETAYSVMALTDYLLSTQQADGEAAFTVLLNGMELSSGVLQPGDRPVQIAIPYDAMKKGANLLQVRREGEGRLYFAVTSRIYIDVPQVEATGVVQVKREYLDTKNNGTLKTIHPGQLVKVRITVKIPRQQVSYLMIEDHLPAGLEALNESLNTTSHDSGNMIYDDTYGDYISPLYWEELGYNNKEIREGRVTFFITDFAEERSSTRTFVYLARATHVGTFTALPAEVEAMYDETLWGRSASDVIVVKEQ